MFHEHVPKIKKGDKVLIGLGDSFTQGVGAYTDAIWKKYNNKIDGFTFDKKLIAEQYEGSWVKQLCDNYLTDYVPVNMGHAGIGNRGCVKQLYLNNRLTIDESNEVIVVFLMTGLERFDFVNKDWGAKDKSGHYSFEAMWPNYNDPTATNYELWKAYATHIYSERFIAVELLLSILEVQTYCKAHGYKFFLASAFDLRANRTWLMRTLCGLIPALEKDNKNLIDRVDWSNYIYPNGSETFLQELLKLENNPDLIFGGWWKHYINLDKPSEYITNCCHPTRKGHAVIAKLLYDSINERK
jgi:lysophospholipase L1-like esterase